MTSSNQDIVSQLTANPEDLADLVQFVENEYPELGELQERIQDTCGEYGYFDADPDDFDRSADVAIAAEFILGKFSGRIFVTDDSGEGVWFRDVSDKEAVDRFDAELTHSFDACPRGYVAHETVQTSQFHYRVYDPSHNADWSGTTRIRHPELDPVEYGFVEDVSHFRLTDEHGQNYEGRRWIMPSIIDDED